MIDIPFTTQLEQTVSHQESWRDVLKRALSNPKRRRQVADTMQVNEFTLRRWWTGEVKRPPYGLLNQLLAALPEEHEELSSLLRQDFPDFKPLLQPDIVLQEIGVEFYTLMLDAYCTTATSQRFWTLASRILQQILDHLEGEASVRFQLNVVRCIHPAHAYLPVRSLYEGIGLGTPPYGARIPELRAYHLGAESLSGYVVSRGVAAIVQNVAEEYPRIPVHWAQGEQSAAAFPLILGDGIAGALRVSVSATGFFTDRIQKLLSYYSRLLVLAFSPEDFFLRDRIRLEVMPYYLLQDKVLANFSARVAKCVTERNYSYSQAERFVRLEIEEELRHLALTSPQPGEEDAQADQSEPG